MPDALLVSSSFLPGHGGIETYLAQLCDALAPRLAVLAQAERDGEPLPSDLPYPTIGYDARMWVPSGRVTKAIERAAAAVGTERVLFGTPWPLGLLGPQLARHGLRYAAIVHGAEMLIPAAVPVLRARLAHALARAELLLVVSNYTGAKLREMLAAQGLEVPPIERMPSRVDTTRFHPEVETNGVRARLGIDRDARVVLCFGRLVKRKGADRAIEATTRLKREGHNLVVVIGGTGPQERRLRKLAQELHAPAVFAGAVPHPDAPALYALADVFAFPVVDRWYGLEVEGLGVVLLEAQACGTPCVTGRSGGTVEAIVDGDTGYVIDGANVDELVDRLRELVSDSDKAARMGRAGRGYVESEFAHRAPPQALLEWLE